MKRHAFVIAALAVLSAVVGAQNPRRPVSPADQARLLEQNRNLLKATVESSLNFSPSGDHLERVANCNKLVQYWAGAVEQAAKDRHSARAVEMGAHLNKLVEKGVAENLRIAREKITSGSISEPELFRNRDEAVHMLRKLEEGLEQAPGELRSLRETVSERRRSVEAAAPAIRK